MGELSHLDALILCGGRGTRLKSISGEEPKPMIKIGKTPFLNYLVEQMIHWRIRRIILCTGYQKEIIREYFSKKKYPKFVNILFSEEDVSLGTAGALRHASSLIGSDPFIVLNGDSFCEVNFKTFLKFHQEKGSVVTLAIKEPQDSSDYGLVRIDQGLENEGRIVSFQEKKKTPSFWINAGIYVLNKEVLNEIPENESYSLEVDLFPRLIQKKTIFGFKTNGLFIDIGTPERYLQAQTLLKNYQPTYCE